MSEHTPGKWRVKKQDEATHAILCDTEPGLTPLLPARIPGNGDACIANAQLMAASPKLLAACKAAQNSLLSICASHPHLCCVLTIAILHDAIAKAKNNA